MPSVQIQMLFFSSIDCAYLVWGEENNVESSAGCLWTRPRNDTWYRFLMFHFFFFFLMERSHLGIVDRLHIFTQRVEAGWSFYKKIHFTVSPESSYFKGLFYSKQRMSCFDLVTLPVLCLPHLLFYTCQSSASEMHVPSHSVLEKHISVKYFGAFQC